MSGDSTNQKVEQPNLPQSVSQKNSGLLGKIGNFLFGKNPEIFDSKGNVIHNHPKKKWDQWQNRFKTDPQYNWRNHTGTRAGQKKTQTP